MPIDVLIVGAGPAGLYAAYRLAKHGLAVRVLEEHDTIGEPVHCTGILGTEAFALPGVPRDTVLARLSVARFHSPVGHELAYAGREGEVCVIDRGAFDGALAATARAAGADISTRARVTGLAIDRDGAIADVRGPEGPFTLRASVCVLACGASYRLQRSLGWGMPSCFMGSAQTEMAARSEEELRVFLRPELLPGGFGWLVPIVREGAARAKIGVMAPSGARRALQRLIGDMVGAGRVTYPVDSPVTRLLPLGPLGRTFGDRVVAVGDAAGLVKPTTGGGIYYGLLTAAWAADVLTDAFARGRFCASVLGAYEEAWRRHLGRELRVGAWFRQVAARLTATDLDLLAKLAIEDGLVPLIRSVARFNWHQQVILRAIRHPGVLQIVARRLVWSQPEAAGTAEWMPLVSDAAYP
jgi:geranylgeranyl reductase family protein